MKRLIAGLLSFWAGVAAGLLLGYAAGVALAPVGGDEARDRLRREARALGAQPLHIAERTRERVETAVEEGKRAAAQKRRELAAETGIGDEPPGIAARDLPV